jgi:hypothetical protein
MTAAPLDRRRTPRLSRMLRTAENERSVNSAISRNDRPAWYAASTYASTRPLATSCGWNSVPSSRRPTRVYGMERLTAADEETAGSVTDMAAA